MDAQRDLAAIGDEDFFEHGGLEHAVRALFEDGSGWPNSTGCVGDEDLRDRAGARRRDRVHRLHRLDDEQRSGLRVTVSPTLTKGAAPGCGRR